MATETQTRGYVLPSHRVAIHTRYYGPTNTRGSRIGVTHNGGKRIYVPWDYALNSEENHAQAVAAYLDRMGWDGRWMTGASADSMGYVAVWVGA